MLFLFFHHLSRAIDNEKKWDIFLKKNSNQKQSHKNRWAEEAFLVVK